MKTPFHTFLITGVVASLAVLTACGDAAPAANDEQDQAETQQEHKGSPWISETVGPEEFMSLATLSR